MNYWLTVCAVLFIQWVPAQKLTLETETKIPAVVGQEFVVKLNVKGIQKYSIKVVGNPPSSQLRNDKFTWTPKSNETKNYFLKFLLLDSLGVTRDEANMVLSTGLTDPNAVLVFDRPVPDTISVVENETFSISGTMRDGSVPSAQSLMVYFLFNENPDVRSFDSCRITRMGDQIFFRWTPSNKEAIIGFAKFRITVVDTDNSARSQVINFKIKSVNQPPIFKTEIPDTVFVTGNGDLSLDFSAVDPDNDNLKYDFKPKSPLYYWRHHQIIFRSENQAIDEEGMYPVHLTVSVTDGEHEIKRAVCILNGKQYRQLLIGDFTQKEFDEGDSILTYLNFSNDGDLKDYDIKLNDLALPQGIGRLAPHLAFQKGSSYIKVHSKGLLPYYLVDRDFTYNIAVTLSNREKKAKPVFKVLELTIRDRPDPTSMGHQKDSLLQITNMFLKTEGIYKSNLEKLYSRTNRPWWKKAATITGTLSGVLSIIQSQAPNKDVSVVAAGISLISITVTNLPSLTEKTLTELNNKISNSKGRIEHIQEKESDFQSNWSSDIDREAFDKMRADLLERIRRGYARRQEDVCLLLSNKKLNRKIGKLTNAKAGSSEGAMLKNIFSCTHSLSGRSFETSFRSSR